MNRAGNLRSERVVQEAMLLMGVGFFVWAVSTESPVMAAEVYGEAIGRYPAEWWAVSVIGASLAYLWGIRCYSVRYWRAAVARIVGLFWHTATITAFGLGALEAVHGKHLVVFSAAILFIHARFALWTLFDVLRGRERATGDVR